VPELQAAPRSSAGRVTDEPAQISPGLIPGLGGRRGTVIARVEAADGAATDRLSSWRDTLLGTAVQSCSRIVRGGVVWFGVSAVALGCGELVRALAPRRVPRRDQFAGDEVAAAIPGPVGGRVATHSSALRIRRDRVEVD
jgi:hypothetical protein